MNFNFYMPVNIISGENCISKNPDELIKGKKALIVTGKKSAKLCGAFDDVTSVLEAKNIGYEVFDKITENPLAETCFEGGKLCRDTGCDFIIAIGGGSPIDGAKAISAYAKDASISVTEIYTKGAEVECLPIVAVPTTAGTGSEANAYSVLTLPGGDIKKTFRSPTTYPKTAFVDAKYTMSLNREYTISCALDTLAHSIESYLSLKASVQSELLSMWAAKEIWDIIFKSENRNENDNDELTYQDRQRLMFASCAAGIAINHTGTGFPHPLGYSITLLEGIPHGRACGIFEGKYLEFNERTSEGKTKLGRLYSYIGIDGSEMKSRIPKKSNVRLSLSSDKIKEYVDRVSTAGNYVNSPYVISYDEMIEIYTDLFGK